MKIAFFGSSDFAVVSLHAILQSNHEVLYVVTAPDAPAGRGLRQKETPIKKFALYHNLQIFQPVNLQDVVFLSKLKSLPADIGVVVSFRKIPRELIEIYPKKMINLHASYLPDYRGAAPIHWAIINGEQFTGVSSFFLNEFIDSGDVILREKVRIEENDTFGTLSERLATLGASVLLKTLEIIEKGDIKVVSQTELIAKENWHILHKAPKILNDNCFINWKQNAYNIFNFVRGLSPEPCAISILNHTAFPPIFVKIHMVQVVNKHFNLLPGEVLITKKNLYVGCGDEKSVEILIIQPQSRRIMKSSDFINGLREQDGWFFS